MKIKNQNDLQVLVSIFPDDLKQGSLSIPEGVEVVDESVLYPYSDLSRRSEPPKGPLAPSNSLTSLTFPASLSTIKSGAFKFCEHLKNLVFPDNLTIIRSLAFQGCRSLISITLPKNLEKLGGGAFRSCSALTSVTLPDSLNELDMRVFSECTALVDVTLPISLKKIDPSAFDGCTNLTSLLIDANDPKEFNRIKTLLPEKLRAYAIPKKVHEAQQKIIDGFYTQYPDLEMNHLLDSQVKQLIGPQDSSGYYILDSNIKSEVTKFLNKDYAAIKKAMEQIKMPELPFELNQQWAMYEKQLREVQLAYIRKFTAQHIEPYFQLLIRLYREFHSKWYGVKFFPLPLPIIPPDKEQSGKIMQKRLKAIERIMISFTKGNTHVLSEEEKKLLQQPSFLAKIPSILREELGLTSQPAKEAPAASPTPSAAGLSL